MGVVANPLVVRIFINSTLNAKENGWAERWPIWETDWNAGLEIAAQMVAARQNILSSNAYIEWACLGTVAPPYYEQTVVTDTLSPLPQWGPAAFDMQGVLFTLATAEGINAPRLIRAVEGTSINAKLWKYADMLVPATPPALPADLTTAPKDLLWQNSLATFRQYASTQQPMSDGHHGEGDGYWVEPFAQMVYRGVSSRRVGRPWKRVSWEAYPYANAPQFSPCGCVVTVNRDSYTIPCRFGVGWALRGIHYYFAREGATVMTFQTPFCCWDRSKEYTDFSGVGEARKMKITDWQRGPAFGNAPGVMWTGPQSYFEGFAPEPPMPTPTFMLPTCDKPPPPVPPSWSAERDDDRERHRRPTPARESRPPFPLRHFAWLSRPQIEKATPGKPAHEPEPVLSAALFAVTSRPPRRQTDDIAAAQAMPGRLEERLPRFVPARFSTGLVFRHAEIQPPPPPQPAPAPIWNPAPFLSSPPAPPPSLGTNAVASPNFQVSSWALAWAGNTTAGSTLIAIAVVAGATIPSPPTGWRMVSTQLIAAGVTFYVFDRQNAPMTSSTTFTLSGNGWLVICAAEAKGAAVSSFDTQATASGSTSLAATGTTGILAHAQELVVAGVAWAGAAHLSGPGAFSGGYTLLQSGFNANCGCAIAYLQTTSTAGTGSTCSLSGSVPWAGNVEAYHG